MGPAAPPQAPAGHVNLDQSTLATGKKHHVGERESFGSGVICGGDNLAYSEESDIVFFTTITLVATRLSCDSNSSPILPVIV